MIEQPIQYQQGEKKSNIESAYLYYFLHHDDNGKLFLTSAAEDMVVTNAPAEWDGNPKTFLSTQIAHNGIQISSEFSQKAVEVQLAAKWPDLNVYFLTAPTSKVTLKIYRVNKLTDPDYEQNIMQVFKGELNATSFLENGFTGTFVPLIYQVDKPVPRFFYQKKCNHVLYDSRTCKVNRNSFKGTGTISSWNRFSRTVVTTLPNSGSFYSYGYMTDIETNRKITITKSSGSAGTMTLYLQYWLLELEEVGRSIEAFAGCLHDTNDCSSKFSNLANYGGHPYIPIENPSIDGIA